ncbi:MAG: Translation factor guf1 mitochondrial [Bogoriella megaspora]|nr:MAG: Translation factor guf1 mitochondrial [Bogoriella megaspora]
MLYRLSISTNTSRTPYASQISTRQPNFFHSTILRQPFASSSFRAASSPKQTDLEKRIAAIPIERFRNFCIVAHVDHGKSTLSDRLLELTGTIEAGGGKAQILDKLDVERERGITVKAQTCSMIYNHKGEDYLLHLVDTPGHVDFRAEVSRSYASCGGALLLVDASQGVQAQTVANFYLAFSQGLKLVPVINKVDLPSADPDRALEQMQTTFELEPKNAVLVSAKTGLNVENILPAVIEQIPAPVGEGRKPLRLLLVDSWYSNYKGVILLVRIFDGIVKGGDNIVSLVTGLKYTVGEVGIMYPDQVPQPVLRAGQVGYIVFNPGMKRIQEAKIGDTYTTVGSEKVVELLPGFEEPKSMVFVAAFPVDQSDYQHLEDSINQVTLNDRSVTVHKESSEALGAGWRLGFLGTLHCSVFEDRLRQEHGASIIITPPTVPFKVNYKDGREEIIQNPNDFPDADLHHFRVAEIQEPFVIATITLPEEYLGQVMVLCESNRGEQKELSFFTATQVILKYELPLAQLVDDFFGKLKGATKGYASLDYEDAGWRSSNLVKLQLLVNKAPVDAVARVIHHSQRERLGKSWVTKFKEHVDRQMFEVVIQAAAGRQIVARETIKPFRKDVLQKLHASDVSRRRKLLEKQKEVDDVFIRTLGEIVKEKMEHDARRLGDDFPEEAIKKYVVNDFKIYSSIRRLQEQVEDQTGQTLDKRGHFLYYFLCRVVWQINEERHLVNVREEEECKTTDVAKARNVKRRLREEEGCKTIGVAKKVRKVRRRFREKADLNTIGVPEGYESEEAIKDPEN